LVLAAACRQAGSEPTRAAPSISASSPELPSPKPSLLHLPEPEAAPSSSSEQPAPEPARDPLRVVVVGDSLSDPAVGGGAYVSIGLKGCAHKDVVNLAKGGFMVNQMRKKLERELTRLGRASHVVVFGGVNDVYSDETAGRVPAKITADLATIYELGRSLGARVIGVTIAPWGGFRRWYTPKRGSATEEVNAWIRKQLADGKLDGVVDASRLLACGDPERLCPEYEPPFRDGLHFGPKGQEVLGQALAGQFPECR
jgi:lysophospholipase L1-like esterase